MFANYLIIAEKEAYRKPDHLSFEVAVALPIASVTAVSGLVDRIAVRPGFTVHVAGCLGGIGRSAVQLLPTRGAVVSSNCSADRRGEALAPGLKELADYRNFDVASFRGRFDMVFDTAGRLTMKKAASRLKPAGRAVHAAPTA